MKNTICLGRVIFFSVWVILLISCGGNGPETTTGTNDVRMLTVTSPANNSVVKHGSITVSGTVDDPNTTVTVNGIEASVSGSQFSAPVKLAEGTNTLNVVAHNDTGQSTVSINVALNTTQMCGTGDTFTVILPGVRLENDPSTLRLPKRTLPDDSVTLPKGCSIYAIFVHGYSRNDKLDGLMFYKLAKFVAEQNGYVHWSWWNNFLGEYLARPLHANPLALSQQPDPGALLENALAFAIRDGKSKAVPDEDFQFQADAERVLRAIKSNNPDAKIIIAGHSMGGNAVARLGRNTHVDIDLLAPIDPVGNRNSPAGIDSHVLKAEKDIATPGQDGYEKGNETYNWTRWRATRRFRGYKKWDCDRNNLNLCIDYDSRVFHTKYKCGPIGDWLDKPPLRKSNAPLKCPRDWPYYDAGITTTFKNNVKRLYHRWQKEAYFPYDFNANYYFKHWAVRSTSIFGPNYQAPVLNNAPGQRNPDKTCKDTNLLDPRNAVSFNGESLFCDNWDGHGEIIGMRSNGGNKAIRSNLHSLALTAQPVNWDDDVRWFEITESAQRRSALLQMAEPGTWVHEPRNPNLDLVVDDRVAITQRILEGDAVGEDVTPPVTSASLSEEPNSFGWNNTDVVVTLTAIDEDGGSGVKEIVYTMTGANDGSGTHAGDHIEMSLTSEGTTTIEYYARDNAGNQEEMKTLSVNIDKTPPVMEATVEPQPNEHGWNNTDVTVTFTAEDALSGVLTVSEPVTVTEEGENQEVIGHATDKAGNSASIGVIVNIDKTPPVIIGLPEDCDLWPPDHKLVDVADIVVTDTLSGVDTWSVSGISDEPESEPGYGNTAPDIQITGSRIELRSERYSLGGRTYDLSVSAIDRAGNTAESTASCMVPHDQRP